MDDLTQVSDEQLQATYQARQQEAMQNAAAAPIPDKADLSKLSDEELQTAALGHAARQEQAIAPFREEVRQQAASGQLGLGESEGVGPYLARMAASPIRGPLSDLNYAYAKGKINDGTATEEHYRVAARYEHEKGLDQQQPEWAKWAGTGLSVAGNVAPTALSGGANIAGQAYAGGAAQTGSFGTEAVQASAVPFAVQIGVLKAMGPIAGKLLPGLVQSTAGRIGGEALTGTAGMAVADYGTYLAGITEHGGPIKDAIDGKLGDAARQTVGNLLFTGALAAAHGTPAAQAGESARAQAEAAIEKIQAPAEKPVNAPGAARPEGGQTPVGGAEVAPPGQPQPPPAENAVKPSTWLTEAIDRHNTDAEHAGVADLIEQRAGEGATGAKIVQEIKPKLAAAGLDPNDARTIVNAVRSRRGIPSQDDTAEFAKWQGEWRSRQTADDSTGLAGMGKGMADAITGNLYRGLFESLQKGSDRFAGIKDPALAKAKPFFDDGTIKSPEDLQALANNGWDPVKAGLARPEPPQFAGMTDADVIGIAKASGFKLGKNATRAEAIEKMTARPVNPAAEAINRSVAESQPPEERRSAERVQAGEAEVLRRGQPMDPAEAHALDKFGEGNVARVDLMAGGRKVGHATIAEEGDSVHVAWMGASGLAGGEGRGDHPFGTREVFSLAHDLARAMPDAKWLKFTPSEGRIRPGEARVLDLEKFRLREADQKAIAEAGPEAVRAAAASPHDKETAGEIQSAAAKAVAAGADPESARRVVRDSVANTNEAHSQEPAQSPGGEGAQPEAEGGVAPPSVRPDVAELRDRVLAGDDVPIAELVKAGLTRNEAHTLRERAMNKRTLEDIGNDKTAFLRTYTKGRVEQFEKGARSKLGIEGSIQDAVIARERAANAAAKVERGEQVDPSDLHADPQAARIRLTQRDRQIKEAQDELQRIADQFADAAERGLLTDERIAELGRQAEKFNRVISGGGEGPPAKDRGRANEPAGRGAGQPEAVRRGPGEAIPGPAANAAAEEQIPGPPAAALAGGPPADAGGQAAGDQLAESPGLSEEQLAAADAKARELAAQEKAASPPAGPPAPPGKPLSPFEREWSKKAAEAGLSFDDLKDGAAKFLAENEAKVQEHNDIVRRAVKDLDTQARQRAEARGQSGLAVKGFNWSSVRSLAAEDWNSVYGIDTLAANLADVFAMPSLDPEKLFDMLQEGIRKPMTKGEALQHTLDDFLNHQEAARAEKEAQGAGEPQRAIEEALRRGQEDGDAQSFNEEGPPGHGGDDELLSAGEAEHGAGGEAGDFDPFSPNFGMGAAALGELNPGTGGVYRGDTALANARIDAERVKEGMSPIIGSARMENAEAWDAAMRRIGADPEAPKKLIEQLVNKPRTTDTVEQAMLLREKIRLDNEYRVLGKQLTQLDGKDLVDVGALRERVEELGRERYDLALAVKRTGTELGRSLQFRKQLAAEDYSLSGMLQEFRIAYGREPNEQETVRVAALQEKIAALQEKLDAATKAYGDGERKFGSKGHFDMTKARVASLSAQGEFRDLVAKGRQENKPTADRIADWLVKLRVNEVISSPVTLAKIAAASASRFATTPMEEGVGALVRQLPGLARIAALAPREGRGFTLSAEKASLLSGLTQGFADALRTVRTGKSELDVQHGSPETPRDWLDLQFGLHGGTKAPAVRAEWTRSVLQRMDAESAAGKDPTKPAALLRIEGEAYRDAKAAKFQQENWLVDAYNRAVNSMRSSDSPAANAAGLAARLLVPVVRIPTNLAFEVGNYAFGTGVGSARLMKAWMGGIENLKPEQADAILRNFKKGSLGAAGLLIGYLNPQTFGGYYAGKKDDKDVKTGGMRLGGVDVPTWLLHNPLLETLQLGATVRRASDKIYKGQAQGTGAGIYQGLAGWVEEIPLARNATDMAKAISPDPKERGRWLGETAKSFAVPQLIQWLAGQTDKTPQGQPQKRKPQGVIQSIESGVPGLRQTVPAGR